MLTRSSSNQVAGAGLWPRNLPLLELGASGWGPWRRGDLWTLNQATLNVLLLGQPGAGKSTSLSTIIRAGLRAGFGGLFLCYKRESAREYERLAAVEGRTSDVIIVQPGATPNDVPKHACNIINWSMGGAHAADVNQLTETIREVMSALSARYGNAKGDDEWERMALRLLRNMLELEISAHGRVQLRTLIKLIQHLPEHRSELEHADAKPALHEVLALARERAGRARQSEVQLATEYLEEWAGLASRTRSSITTTLLTTLDAMMRYPLKQLFFEETTFTPDDILNGKIVVLDLPVETYFETARAGAMIFKFALYRALKARTEEESWRRPVFVCADEAQAFVTRTDTEMANVSRSARLVLLAATQNIPNLYSSMGGDATGKADVDSLISNLQTRIVTNTNEPQTAEWLSNSLGKVLKQRHNENFSVGANGQWNLTDGSSQVVDYDVQPRAWSTLAAGGPENNGFVDAVVMGPFMGGRRFEVSGKRYLRLRFDQTGQERSGSVRIVAPQIRVSRSLR